jgi:glutathione synthase/RimK-type ligase-like ATP-grasp enzyme
VILIVTNREDQTADWLILELEQRGAEYARFNTEGFPGATTLSWASDASPTLTSSRYEIDLSTVSAVWYRRPIPADVTLWPNPERGRWALGETRAALEGIWRTMEALWVNHPDDNRRASTKVEQLHRARRLGFRVPRSLVTNDRARVRAFASLCGEPGLICKPLEEGLLEFAGPDIVFFTSRFALTPDDTLEDFGPEPYLFQEFIDKLYDVRVTVIGDRVFATRIESQATETGRTDWRQAGAEARHAVETLPEELSGRCLDLIRSYNLRFAAIDLAYAADDGYVFFEINPNGQWAWLEQLTGQPLRSAMADLLEGGRP